MLLNPFEKEEVDNNSRHRYVSQTKPKAPNRKKAKMKTRVKTIVMIIRRIAFFLSISALDSRLVDRVFFD